MHRPLHTVFTWSRWPLALWFLALLVCGGVISRSHFVADMSAFLPRNPTAQQQLLVDQITRGSLSRTLLMGIVGGTQGDRATLSRELTQRLRASGQFALVSNGEASDNGEGSEASEGQFFLRNRYLLSTDVTLNLFTVPGLHQAIEATIDTLAGSMGGSMKAVFLRDPTGELLKLLEEFGSASRPQSIDGVWMSHNGERAMLIALSKADGADTDTQEALLQQIHTAFAQLQQSTGLGAAQLQVSGSAVFAVDARTAIKTEVTRLSVISALGVMGLLLLVFRSLRALGLCMLPVFSGAVLGTVAVSLVFGNVHGITIGFGSTLIGEAVDYSIYYLIQSKGAQNGDPRAGTSRWLQTFWPTVRLGMLTSICGFLALIFSGFPGLAQLGVYSIAGLVAAAAVTRFVLPQFAMPARQFRPRAGLVRAMERAVAGLQKLPKLMLLLVSVALVFLWAHREVMWNPALSGLSPVSGASQRLDESLRADLGAPEMRHLIAVQGHDLEATLVGAEAIGEQLLRLQASHLIDSFESPAKLIPSQATQRRRQQALPEPAALSARLAQAVQGLPIQVERLQPFLDDVAAARQGPLLTREQLGQSRLVLSFDALMMTSPQRATAFMPVRQVPEPDGTLTEEAQEQKAREAGAALLQAATAAQDQLRRQGDSTTRISYIDMTTESVQIYARYFHEILVLSAVGVLAIVALLAYSLKSWRDTAAVLAPLALAVVLVMFGLVAGGERLTLLHLVGLLLIVAVGSNYALFFNRRDDLAPSTVLSLLLANASTSIGFGVLAFSSVPVLHALGVTVAPGAMLALLASVMFARHLRLRDGETN